MILAPAFAASLIPSVALYLWLKKQNKAELEYPGTCRKALIYGFLSALPVLLLGTVAVLFEALVLDLKGQIARDLYRTFVLYALTEELAKFYFFRKLLIRCPFMFSWRDATIFMAIIGLGFGLLEDIPYGLSTNAGQMLVRGVTIAHGGLGFIMGYFCGKAMTTGKRRWYAVGFLLPYLLHGLYDFSLSDAAELVGDWTIFTAVTLAALDVVLIVLFIRFVRRSKTKEKYLTPVLGGQAPPLPEVENV